MYKLMIVDDEPLTREYMKIHIPQLTSRWQVAAEAMDGSEAYEQLQRGTVDLVITDIKMPVMNGLELCRRISAQYPRTKLVILSGHDEFSLAKEAMRYGAGDYLLKPIVREQLEETLNRIAAELDSRQDEEMAYRALRGLSVDTTSQAVKNFLKAVVSESGLEIKTLYPLIHRMHISLIEAEGAVMILDLDLDSLLHNLAPSRDVPLFQFILHQVVTEIAEQDKLGTVFLDEDQHVCCLIPGDDREEIIGKSRRLHDRAAGFMRENTKLAVTAAVGSAEDNILQMNQSFDRARRMLQCRLVEGGGRLFVYSEREPGPALFRKLEQSLASIQSALLEGSDSAIALAIGAFTDTAAEKSASGEYTGSGLERTFRFGVFLIERLSEMRQIHTVFQRESAQYALTDLINTLTDRSLEALTRQAAAALFMNVVNRFRSSERLPEGKVNETGLVSQAKDYIDAHYAEPLSLALIAEKAGVSSAYLSNLFHKQMNEPYIKYLTRIRMEQAARLLKLQPPEKVYDVALKVGYISVKHFSHMFKQHFGMPPGEFQEGH